MSIFDIVFIGWALTLCIIGKARLVPFAVLCAVSYVAFYKIYGAGHFYQQLSAGFIILAAMYYTRAPQPQRFFIITDIAINSCALFFYLIESPLYPHIARASKPLILLMTTLILLAITDKSLRYWLNKRREHRKQKKVRSWSAKEIANGRR